MINIGITSEQDYIGLLPSQVVHLLARRGKPLPLDAVITISFIRLQLYQILVESLQNNSIFKMN